MSDFDEKSPPISVETPWGRWWQTSGDVQIEMNLHTPTTAKKINCRLTTTSIALSVDGKIGIQGKLYAAIKTGDSTWTLEDGRTLRVLMCKAMTGADRLWQSLLDASTCEEAFAADCFTQNEMQKKLTLERMQLENPGMDFSAAEITGNYQNGGPNISR